jgi:hypothetical protein
MEVKSIFKRAFLPIVAISLFGCGSDIDKVKESKMPYFDVYEVGQALDTRDWCDETKWEQFETERGLTVVEYTCEKLYTDSIEKTDLAIDKIAKESHQQVEKEIQRRKDFAESIKVKENELVLLEEKLRVHISEHGSIVPEVRYQDNLAKYADYSSIQTEQNELKISIINLDREIKSNATWLITLGKDSGLIVDVDFDKHFEKEKAYYLRTHDFYIKKRLVAQFTITDGNLNVLYTGSVNNAYSGVEHTARIDDLKFFTDMYNNR